MPTYIGYSSVKTYLPVTSNTSITDAGDAGLTQPLPFSRRVTLTDEQLVTQDLINALSIRQGEKPGNPAYGTTLWNFIFEPNVPEIQSQIENEVRRVANQDSRINLNSVRSYSQQNGILIEVELAYRPFNNAMTVGLFFNQATNSIQGA